MGLGGGEEFLQEVPVGREADGGALGDGGGEVEEGVAVVVLGDLDEVLGAGVGEEVDPVFWREGGGGEVLDEGVVGVVWAVGGKVVLVGLVFGVWAPGNDGLAKVIRIALYSASLLTRSCCANTILHSSHCRPSCPSPARSRRPSG